MKFLFKAAALAAMLCLSSAPALAQSLTTAYDASELSQNGNIFDLAPNKNLTIDSFDINYESNRSVSLNATVEVYWREGTANGFENSSEGWNLMGSASIVGQTWGSPTPVAIGGLAMMAGHTYGIYIHVVESNRYLAYTSGGPSTFSNADLSLTTFFGVVNGDPLLSGQKFYPRQWNGTVYYHPTTTCASEGYRGTQLTWCQNICEKGLTGAVLDTWIHRWIRQYRTLPYCAVEQEQQPD